MKKKIKKASRPKKAYRELSARALSLGAVSARVIDAATVVTAEWVLYKCRFGCPGWGGRHSCPPRTPAPSATARMIEDYSVGVLFGGGDNEDIHKIVFPLEREAFLRGFYKAFGFASGPCRLCARCDLDASCRRPWEMRPAMEACGIDVFATARANGYKIETLKSEKECGSYFGLLLVE